MNTRVLLLITMASFLLAADFTSPSSFERILDADKEPEEWFNTTTAMR